MRGCEGARVRGCEFYQLSDSCQVLLTFFGMCFPQFTAVSLKKAISEQKIFRRRRLRGRYGFHGRGILLCPRRMAGQSVSRSVPARAEKTRPRSLSGLGLAGRFSKGSFLIWAIPTETWAIPTQTWAIPTRTWAIPTQTWAIPTRTWAIPIQTWAIPNQTWAIPSQTWAIPSQTWAIPNQTWAIPSQTWAIPTQTWAIPTQTWAIPTRTWAIPTRTWAIPTQTWAIPIKVCCFRLGISHSA